MRRVALLGLLFTAAILSCGKDVTGPLGAAARYVRGLAFEPVFPPAFQLAGGSASGLVQFSKVHVVLHHSDGTVALDTTIDYPADSSSVTLALTVKLLDGAPATGEPMNLDLDYVNSTGQTVFHGGPVAITAAPPPAGGGSNPPVQVPVTYTGPGATATAVVISPRTISRVAGQSFSFSAIATDQTGATLANTPIIWNSLDPSIAAITAASAGAGVAGSVRGTARITAQLLTGRLDQVTVVVTLPASQLISPSGSGQTGVVGTTLAGPLAVKVAASDGVGVAGFPVSFAIASGGGSVGSASVLSDANGIASTTWKLGTATGAQSVTASAAGLTGSPISFGATATAATATQLVITAQPASGAAGSAPGSVVVTAEDANGNIATTFTGGVSLSFGTNTTGASLSGATSVNAVAGVAAFSGLAVNKTGTGYTLVAGSTGLTSATTNPFDITPGAPSKLVFTGQPSSANTNSSIGTVVVSAQDAQGNPTPAFTGTVSIGLASNPGGSTLTGATSASAVGGVATFSGLTLNAAGVGYALSAASSGLTSATSGAFNITTSGGGIATQLVITAQPSNTVAGVPVSPAITVTAKDVLNNVVPSFVGNVTLAIGANPGASAIGGGLVVAAVAGVATFPNINLNHTGVGYTLVATSGALTAATTNTFNITNAAASNFAITAGQGQTGTISTLLPTPLTVKVTDAFGNAVPGQGVGFGSITGGGSLGTTVAITDAAGQATSAWTLGATIGAQSVTATSAGLIGSPAVFNATGAASSLRTWTGAISTNWNVAGNWSPAGIPVATDSVVIPFVTNLPTITITPTIKALTLAPSAVLTFGCATLTINGSLDATGGIVGCGNVVLTSATPATLKGSTSTTLQVQGVYTLNGTWASNSMQIINGSVDMGGNVAAIGAGGVSTAGTSTITFTNVGSTMTTTGGASFAGGSETGKLTAGSLTVASNFNEGGGAVDAYNASLTFATVLNGTVATNFSFTDPASSQFGQLIVNDAAGVTALSNFAAGSVVMTAGTLTGTVNATLNGPLVDPLGGLHLTNITFAGNTTPVSAGTPAITVIGTVTFNNNPSILAASLTISGAVNVLGNLQINGHTLNVNGALSTATNGQLTMSNVADIVNVTGNMTFGSTGVGGPMSAGTLNISGNFMQSGNSQSISTSGTNTVNFNGAAVQSIIFSSPDGNYSAGCVAACFQNFTVNKTGGQLNVLTDVKVQGNFTNGSTTAIVTPVSNGPLIIAGNAAYGQNMTIHRTGVGGTFSKGLGTAIDSVSYFGAAQTYNPATLGEGYSDIRGTANWPLAGTLTGQMVLSGAGQLNVSNSLAVITGNFTSNGTSTLKMTTNTTDTLFVGGIATFAGGATTGLLTTGNLIVSGTSINVTGLAIDASGTFTTILNGTAGTQTLQWNTAVANHGYNNLTLIGAAQRQFSGNQTVAGNMLIMLGSGHVNGSWTLTFGGNITDQTVTHDAWNGSSSIVFIGAPAVLPRTFGVNNATFTTGTVTLADSLKGVGNITVDGATSHLKLNGHYVLVPSNFTTQNGGVLEMTNTHDTLVVGGLTTFNGGNTSGLLTHGYMNISSFVQGVNATAFVADSTLRTSIGQGTATQITFANPGFGPTLSHFGEMMIGDGSTHTLNSNVFVQGQLTTAAGAQFPVTSSNLLITAQGLNATNLFLTNTRLLLVDGSAVTTATNLKFLSMDPTVTQFEVQRSGTAISGDFAATLTSPIFNTAPTSGLYLKATDTNGSAPFLTINVATPTPLASGGFTSALSGAIISGWSSVVTVTSAGTGNWSNPATWTPSVVPTGPGYNAVIATGHTVTVDVNSTVANLTVNVSGTLTLPSTNTLTVSGTPLNNGTTTCSTDNIVLSGSPSINGIWCGLRVTGNTTIAGGTLVTNQLNVQGAGVVDMTTNSLNAGSFSTSGSAILKMQTVAANFNVLGNATFGGGSETTFLTAGTIHITGDFAGGTGAQYNATGTHTTDFNGNTAQNIGWTTPTAGIGFNNVQFNHMHPRTFTSDVYIGGTVQIFSSDTGQFVGGAHRVTLGGTNTGILDQAVSVSSGWQVGATNFAIPGANLTFLPNLAFVDTTLFTGTGTVALPFDQTMKNVVVDNTNLKLNGHVLSTQGNSFTTQNNGTLEMSTSAGDSLNAGFAYFNGGSTYGKLTQGGMALGGLYQGYDAGFVLHASANAAAFSPTGGNQWFSGALIAFKDPGTGAGTSHFWFMQDNTAGAITLQTDMFVDSTLMFDQSSLASVSAAVPTTTTQKITTKDIYNSATVLTLNGIQVLLNDGVSVAPYTFRNVTWQNYPANFTNIIYELNRSIGAPPVLDAMTVSGVTYGVGGFFVKNSGTISVVASSAVPIGCANVTLTTGQTCK